MDVKEKINKFISDNDVCLFMKGTPDSPQCGFSMAVSNVLKHLNVSFKGINVLEDENLIWQLATTHEAIVTIEEGSIGGFGSHVIDFLTKKGLMDSNLKFRSMKLPDIFIDQDKPENMYKLANLDSISIEEQILDVLNSNIILQKQK